MMFDAHYTKLHYPERSYFQINNIFVTMALTQILKMRILSHLFPWIYMDMATNTLVIDGT